MTGALLSCNHKMEELPPAGQSHLRLRLEEPASGRVTLENPLSLISGNRLWRWEETDVPSVIYSLNGEELSQNALTEGVDPDDPSVLDVKVGDLPEGASLKGAAFGSESAFGKTCKGDQDIPSSMVYAKATFSSAGGAVVLPDLTLKHQCSYFLIVPDSVGGYPMISVTITGRGLKGGSASQTIRLSFKDSESGKYIPKWIALSNNAENIVFKVKTEIGEYTMAELPSAGKGKCRLHYVRNKTIGVSYK